MGWAFGAHLSAIILAIVSYISYTKCRKIGRVYVRRYRTVYPQYIDENDQAVSRFSGQ
jgi:hypothetical protein